MFTGWSQREKGEGEKLPKTQVKLSPLYTYLKQDTNSAQHSTLMDINMTALSIYLQQDLCILLSGNTLRIQGIVVILDLKTLSESYMGKNKSVYFSSDMSHLKSVKVFTFVLFS